MSDLRRTLDDADWIRPTLDRLKHELLAARGDQYHWTGQLSASALSTATAISAISLAFRETGDAATKRRYGERIRGGIDWLLKQQNADGGFGDTDRSHSNIATSYLVLAAITLVRSIGISDEPGNTGELESVETSLDRYLQDAGGIAALRQRYGTDKTFVVPILTNLAIAGRVSWDEVSALPFEAAVFPQSMYRFLGMPVVSYAVPALVAIGQVKFQKSGCLPPWSWVRRSCVGPTLQVLQRMQPDSGGFLEATPLTAFVVMSLVEKGLVDHPVVRRGLDFLLQSITPENSWPIDTNLATWVTSLSIASLSTGPAIASLSTSQDMMTSLDQAEVDGNNGKIQKTVEWLLLCQHNQRHPFTGADPGGWGWTDLSGAVPDADDTPGAMIALRRLRDQTNAELQIRIDDACERGAHWLLGLQNRDGGWPTFCRGWGKLPFDRSSVDLTAHAIRAFNSMPDEYSNQKRVRQALTRGFKFLRKHQHPDGSWSPLWFGNQDREEEDNPIYGTAKVLVDADRHLGDDCILGGIEYLIQNQNPDKGWGGGESVGRYFEDSASSERHSVANPSPKNQAFSHSTVEETALAVECLASLYPRLRANSDDRSDSLNASPCLTDRTQDAILTGSEWLVRAIADDRHQAAWPIGFYFAKLWYYEQLYPIVFATAALGRVDALNVTTADVLTPNDHSPS